MKNFKEFLKGDRFDKLQLYLRRFLFFVIALLMIWVVNERVNTVYPSYFPGLSVRVHSMAGWKWYDRVDINGARGSDGFFPERDGAFFSSDWMGFRHQLWGDEYELKFVLTNHSDSAMHLKVKAGANSPHRISLAPGETKSATFEMRGQWTGFITKQWRPNKK